jgi:PhnB protein
MPISPITPYLTVSNARAALDFYQHALGGILEGEPHLMPGTDKIMHARVSIHGGLIMLADDFSDTMARPASTPEALCGSPVTLALHVEDAQAFWDQAVAGGATVAMPLRDTFWGERYGQFTDPFGHKWTVSQTLKVMTDDEMQASAEQTLATKGTLMPESVAT